MGGVAVASLVRLLDMAFEAFGGNPGQTDTQTHAGAHMGTHSETCASVVQYAQLTIAVSLIPPKMK